MADSLALEPSPVAGERTTRPAAKFSLATLFRAALESLVAAQTRKMDEAGPLMCRYPPI